MVHVDEEMWEHHEPRRYTVDDVGNVLLVSVGRLSYSGFDKVL